MPERFNVLYIVYMYFFSNAKSMKQIMQTKKTDNSNGLNT